MVKNICCSCRGPAFSTQACNLLSFQFQKALTPFLAPQASTCMHTSYTCTRTRTRAHARAHTHGGTHLETRYWHQASSSIVLHLWNHLCPNLGCSVWLDCRPASLYISLSQSHAGIAGMRCHMQLLMWLLGSKLRSSCSHSTTLSTKLVLHSQPLKKRTKYKNHVSSLNSK